MDKYLIALALIFLSNSVTAHQNPSEFEYGSYQVGPVCKPSQAIRYPRYTSDVVEIVNEARRNGLTVKAFGARHSMTDIICTDGIPVDMQNFQSKRMNGDGSVTFGSGVIAYEIGVFLKAQGLAFKTAPGYGNITVGGAIGTGAHGSSIKYHSSLSAQVIGLTIVDGMGIVREITEEEDLKAFRIHLGLLGIILDVTFQTVPFYKILSRNIQVEDAFIFDGRIVDYARETDQIMIFWYPMLRRAVIANWTNVHPDTPGNAYINLLTSGTADQENDGTLTMEAVQQMPPADAASAINNAQLNSIRGLINDGTQRIAPFYTEDGVTLENPAVGDWHRMVTSVCFGDGEKRCGWSHDPAIQTRFIDQEIAVDLEDLPDVARRLQDIVTKTPAAFPIGGILFRFSGNSSTYMAGSYGRDSVHVEIFAVKRKNEYEDSMSWLAAYQTFFQSMTEEFRGRSHWGKSAMHYHSTDMIHKKMDPVAKTAFIDKMLQYDPARVFMNSFGRRLVDYETKQDSDPNTTHCALQDNCVCSSNDDCGPSRSCTSLQGYQYRVCA